MSSQQQKLNKLKNKPAHNAMRNIAGRKIAILGLGIENYALVKYANSALRMRTCEYGITICDARNRKELNKKYGAKKLNALPVKWRLGKNYDRNLKDFDIIFRSPGYPLFKLPHPNPLLIRRGNKRERCPIISSPMKLFFELCPTKNIIGVTGTKGKGTTASLIYHILKNHVGTRHCHVPTNIFLGGNIGIAPFEFIDKIKKDDWVVLELSSFQLEDMNVSPRIAVITNFSREHLAPADPNNPNYHRTLADYWNAKMNIIRWQKKGDKAVLSKKLEVRIKKHKLKSKIYTFSAFNKNADCHFTDNHHVKLLTSNFLLLTSLLGEHNKENIAAAIEAVKLAGAKQNVIKKAVAGFKGLEHRIEHVKNISGVKYYNDSFATTPESAITALKSFDQPIILLAGGADKGSDFKQLAKEIKKRAKFVVLLNGKATPRLKKELLKIKYPENRRHGHRHGGASETGGASKMKLVYNIKNAVKTARQTAEKGDIILLSPACASFGMFKNYKERGEMFKQEVKKLK